LTDTLSLTGCADGIWLYDKTRGMNLSMGAKSERLAFMAAIEYYQNRCITLETAHNELTKKVEAFVSQFVKEDDTDV
jgi:hypothetical protein